MEVLRPIIYYFLTFSLVHLFLLDLSKSFFAYLSIANLDDEWIGFTLRRLRKATPEGGGLRTFFGQSTKYNRGCGCVDVVDV